MSGTPLRYYLSVLRRHALVLAVMPVLAVTVAALITARQEPTYQTDMNLFVGQAGGGLQPAIGTQPLTQTMTNLLESDVVARTAIERLQLDTTPKKVGENLSVSVKPSSAVLDVSLVWPDKREAVALLDEIAAVFTERVRQKLGLSSSGTTLGSTSSKVLFFTTVFDPPHVLPGRVSPSVAKNLGFAAVLGLLLGVLFAFIRESLDDRIRGRREAEEAFDAPVIGGLPRGAHKRPLARLQGAESDRKGVGAALRMLHGNLRFSRSGIEGPTVLVTSPQQGEGKTTVTACVAYSLALGGNDVVCVDLDGTSPTLESIFCAESAEVGLVDVLRERVDLEEALIAVDLAPASRNGKHQLGNNGHHDDVGGMGGSLLLLPAGNALGGDLVADIDGTAALIERLSRRADYVLIDSPPLLTSAGAFPFAPRSENVIVVARQGRTTKARAEATRATLKGLGVQRVSVVLTDTAQAESYPER